jgi:competence ComEA-like helix-hairpin-helix protein
MIINSRGEVMKRILKIGLVIAIGYVLYRLLAKYLRPISVRLDQPPYAFPPHREPASPVVSEEPAQPEVEPTRLDLNMADAEALTSLPGIGPTLAERVVAYRSEHGPFASINDLKRVRGIGAAQVNRLGELVTVES